MNALDHGCCAKTLILPGEEPEELERRQAAWSARFQPRDDPESRFLNDAVFSSWQLDRARRAQVARIRGNILNYGVDDDDKIAEQVDELGTRLFRDRCGPLMLYPTLTSREGFEFSRPPSTSTPGKGEDPDRPSLLLLRLQSTLLGCEWLLGQWSELKEILDRGEAWVSSDKLKAVRLMGKQPFDAIDDRDVAMVYLASFVLKPEKETWYWEIAAELASKDVKRFRNSAAIRGLDSLKPADAQAARLALLGVIERAVRRLTVKTDKLRERARMHAELAVDRLAFDDTPGGEKLRRYELASSRGMARSLDKMLKLRAGEVPASESSRAICRRRRCLRRDRRARRKCAERSHRSPDRTPGAGPRSAMIRPASQRPATV